MRPGGASHRIASRGDEFLEPGISASTGHALAVDFSVENPLPLHPGLVSLSFFVGAVTL